MPDLRTFTEEDKDRICRSYQRGVNVRDIAAFYSCGDTAINRVLKERKIPRRESGDGQVETARNQKIIARAEAGDSLRDIAKSFGISPQRVHFIINRGF